MNYDSKLLRLIGIFFFFSVSWLFAQQQRSVAILPFTNSGAGEYDWVSRGIDEILYDKLSNLSALTVFEKETFDRLLVKENVRTINDLNARKAFSLGRESGVDVLIAGYYQVMGGNLLLNFRAVSTYTGADIFNQTFQGSLNQIYRIHEDAITRLMEVMALPLKDSEREMLSRSSTHSSKAFENYCKAYSEFQKGSSLEVVASYFTRALAEDPNFWEAQYNLGVIYYNFDQLEKALLQFNNVVKQNPSFYKPYYGIGVIYYLQRRYRDAKQSFQRVLALNPEHDRSLYYLGRIYVQLDSLEKGLEYLEKAAKVNPNYAPTQYQIALTNMKRGWYKTAIQAFRNSLKLNPDNYRVHNALGECYYLLQRFDEAIYEYTKAIELRPNFSTAYFNLGNTVYKRGALQEIVGAYLEILETRYAQENSVNPNSSIVEDLRRLKHKETTETAKIYSTMIQNYRKALEYEADFFEAAYNLALTYENINMLDSAEYFYQTALKYKPSLVRAHMRLGRLYERQQRYPEALKHFKEVVKIEPSYFSDTPRLGEPYRYINIIETVLEEYQLKYELNPNDSGTLIVLARIFNSLGRYGQAEKYYKQIVQLDPQNREANLALKEIQKQKREL
ncbi:MAG: hypothetical protein Kow0042_04610 [Calditrichia bacterium]